MVMDTHLAYQLQHDLLPAPRAEGDQGILAASIGVMYNSRSPRIWTASPRASTTRSAREYSLINQPHLCWLLR
jgi:hypothetical protein